MIKLKTDCIDCVHSKVCRYKHNARLAMDKFNESIFVSGSGDTYSWMDKMERDHVDVEFSCPDFEREPQFTLRK